jgi:hypothetical protein
VYPNAERQKMKATPIAIYRSCQESKNVFFSSTKRYLFHTAKTKMHPITQYKTPKKRLALSIFTSTQTKVDIKAAITKKTETTFFLPEFDKDQSNSDDSLS